MNIATIANYGSQSGQIEFSVVTIHDKKEVSEIRKFECKNFSDEADYAKALIAFAQEQGAQQIHTVKELLPSKDAVCDCGECLGRISHFALA